ncbi:GNAT family N-acetyltransferase [Paucibacter sp. APW11]|uniref:GNAT family N-acetyltransferase n=1 Tax=Roseateles aquae TaxID=3077235 RepID=A0ABU3P9N8_9BURK|nr:GNAT family N-acetyltransferase [Paucibacter sp. APW11]MDT8998992.1 GNAT family N-acetyltransferase [Paucibacter sp. APW11]
MTAATDSPYSSPLPAALFAQFRADRAALPITGFELDAEPRFSRHLPRLPGAEALICFTRISDEQALVAEIATQQRFFTERQQRLEWKVYELDEPPTLRQRLAEAGFVAGEVEAFMLYPLERPWQPRRQMDGSRLAVRRISDDAGLRALIALQEQVWQIELGWLYQQMSQTLARQPQCLSVFGAYAGRQLVGTGWIDFPAGSAFAELHGGSVLPDWRGQGVYSALLAPRLAEARERGLRWLGVDAAPMSRPILEGLGFSCVCLSWPMRWQP